MDTLCTVLTETSRNGTLLFTTMALLAAYVGQKLLSDSCPRAIEATEFAQKQSYWIVVLVSSTSFGGLLVKWKRNTELQTYLK